MTFSARPEAVAYVIVSACTVCSLAFTWGVGHTSVTRHTDYNAIQVAAGPWFDIEAGTDRDRNGNTYWGASFGTPDGGYLFAGSGGAGFESGASVRGRAHERVTRTY